MTVGLAEWQVALQGIDEIVIQAAVDYCKLAYEWPPSVAQFLAICEKKLGIPSEDETYQHALRREFKHAIVDEVFKAVGSWSFTNDSEKLLREKVKKAYHDCLLKIRLQRTGS